MNKYTRLIGTFKDSVAFSRFIYAGTVSAPIFIVTALEWNTFTDCFIASVGTIRFSKKLMTLFRYFRILFVDLIRSYPRFRYDRLMYICDITWKIYLPIAPFSDTNTFTVFALPRKYWITARLLTYNKTQTNSIQIKT